MGQRLGILKNKQDKTTIGISPTCVYKKANRPVHSTRRTVDEMEALQGGIRLAECELERDKLDTKDRGEGGKGKESEWRERN